MRVNYRNTPDYGDSDSDTIGSKVGSAVKTAAKIGVAAYAAKKIGGGLSDIGEGLKSDGGNPLEK